MVVTISVLEKQQMVGVQEDDIDVIGIAQDEITAAVQIFFVRKGRVIDEMVSCWTKLKM